MTRSTSLRTTSGAERTKAALVHVTRAAWLSDFDPRRNGITAVRLVLALVVLVSHSFLIGGYSAEPLVRESGNTVSLGIVAVLGFFTLSGFLLARSRERTSVGPFLRNRALRIFPGYWLSLLYVVVVAGPVAASISGARLDPPESIAYVIPRLVFIPETSDTQLRAAFDGATINGSLWTLGVEVMCYVFLAVVPARLLRPVLWGEAALLLALLVVSPAMRGPDTGLMFAFAAGALAWCHRDRIPLSPLGVAAALVVTAIGVTLGAYPVIAVGVGYLALAAAWLPVHLERDLSYGVYVLAYPTQTLLAMTAVRAMGLPWLVVASLAIVLPLAWASWTFVERPSLRLKSRGAAGRSLATARSRYRTASDHARSA